MRHARDTQPIITVTLREREATKNKRRVLDKLREFDRERNGAAIDEIVEMVLQLM